MMNVVDMSTVAMDGKVRQARAGAYATNFRIMREQLISSLNKVNAQLIRLREEMAELASRDDLPQETILKGEMAQGYFAIWAFAILAVVGVPLTEWALSAILWGDGWRTVLRVLIAVGIAVAAAFLGHWLIEETRSVGARGYLASVPRPLLWLWWAAFLTTIPLLAVLRAILKKSDSAIGLNPHEILQRAMAAENLALGLGIVTFIFLAIVIELPIAVAGGLGWSSLAHARPRLALYGQERTFLDEIHALETRIKVVDVQLGNQTSS